MTTQDQPITRTDLPEELDRVLAYYATKEDLAQLETRLTKQMGDLKSDLTKAIGDQKDDLKGTFIQAIIGLAGLQLIGLGTVAAIDEIPGRLIKIGQAMPLSVLPTGSLYPHPAIIKIKSRILRPLFYHIAEPFHCP